MQFYTIVTALCCALSASATAILPRQTSPAPPFNFQYLFTITYNLTQYVTSAATYDDVVRLGYQVTGGAIQGPAANGTFLGGTVSPIVYNNFTNEHPEGILYGTIGNGSTFIITISGTVNKKANKGVSQVMFSTDDPKYKYLTEGFLFANSGYRQPGYVYSDTFLVTST